MSTGLRRRIVPQLLAALALLEGCGSRPSLGDGSEASGEEAGDGGSTDASATSSTETTGDTQTDSSTGGEDGDLCCPDWPNCEVDPEPQENCGWSPNDCPACQRCAPLTDSSAESVCTPSGPDGVGEECQDPGPFGGSCDDDGWCVALEYRAEIGTCLQLCAPGKSQCEVDSHCELLGEIGVCLPRCDPLAMDPCPAGGSCVLSATDLDRFVCAPEALNAAAGEYCPCSNCCMDGLACVDAASYGSECGDTQCCTPFCAVSDTSKACPEPTQVCTALFPAGHEFGDVGRCVVP